MNYDNWNDIQKNRMSNTDSWTKENGKMKVSGDYTVPYLSRMSSVLLFKKTFCHSLRKTWYSSKNQAENMKTFQIEKKNMKNMPSCMLELDSSMYSKQTNKMWSLKSLVTLKCDSRTSLHAIQYKWQTDNVLMLYPYDFRNG